MVSSFASRNAYKVVEKYNTRKVLTETWLLTGIIMIILAFFLNSIFVVFVIFVLLYIFLNIRRPLMVELVGNASEPSRRASVLSIESQMTSLLTAIAAPIIGFIADHSMRLLFIIVGIIMMMFYVYNLFFSIHKKQPKTS